MMSSLSNLHARKKALPHDEEGQHGLQPGEEPPTRRRSGKRNGKKAAISLLELECASAAVVFFLVFGLGLGYLLMHHQHRKVIVHVIRNPWAHGGAIFRQKRAGFHHHFYTGSPRFVTVVMPSVVNPKGRSLRLQSIYETWGPRARAIFVVHNQTEEFPQGKHLTLSEEASPYDPYSYPQTLLLPGDFGFDEGVPRLFHTIRLIYKRVDPDFCFFVNDHTFVIPEHLCQYLDDLDPNIDLYAGHALKNDKTTAFNSGAAGYLLSRETMRKLVQKWDEKDDNCWVGPDASPQLQGNPGLLTVKCLDTMGIAAFDTRVEKKYHLFHAFPLTRVVAGAVDQWYHNKHTEMNLLPGYDETYTKLLPGEDCCDAYSISFHYVEYKECKAFFETREALLKNPFMTDAELKSFMIERWPYEAKDIGGYSRGLPAKDVEWKPLLAVIRKISQKVTPRPDSDC